MPRLTRFDMANEKMSMQQVVADIDYELIAGFGMTIAGGDVNPWVPYVGTGSVPEETTAGPEYDETDAIDGRNSVIWTGIGERSKLTKDLERGGPDWGFGCIARVTDTTRRCPVSRSNDANPGNNSTVALYLNDSLKVSVHHITDGGLERQFSDTLTSPDAPLGTGFHFFWVDKSGTTLRLKVDGRTIVSDTHASIDDACTFDRLILGAQKVGVTHFYPFSGAIRQYWELPGRAATTDEIAGMYALAKIIAPGIP